MTQPTIKTTVVGSYPLPSWLAALPSTPNLRDALLVVLKTQELAGIDVVADGELSRFNVNHPETNGMIDYFVAPMRGIETQRLCRVAGLSRPGGDAFSRPTGGGRARGDWTGAAQFARSMGNGQASERQAAQVYRHRALHVGQDLG